MYINILLYCIVCVFHSGKEERPWLIVGVKMNNQSINQSINHGTFLDPNYPINAVLWLTKSVLAFHGLTGSAKPICNIRPVYL